MTDFHPPLSRPVAAHAVDRRRLLGLTAVGAAAAVTGMTPLAAFAQSKYAGRYDVITPAQPVADPSKVEVLEVFSFACPHCWRFNPVMSSYEDSAPEYVNVRRMPAIFRRSWQPLAQAYYVSEALGVAHEMRAPIFDAIHVKRENLVDEASVRKVFVREGVDGAKFDKAWRSFAVKSRMNDGYRKQQALGINATPTVVVHGQYRVTTTLTGSFEGLVEVVRGLADELKGTLKT